MSQKRKSSHYNVSSLHCSGVAISAPAGRRRIIPGDVIREMAKQSKEGGRARCEWCKTHFTVTYLMLCKRANFTEPEWACRDCRKEHELRKA